jgi:hypothetical protein
MIRDLGKNADVSQQLAYASGWKEGARGCSRVPARRHQGEHTSRYWHMGYDDGAQSRPKPAKIVPDGVKSGSKEHLEALSSFFGL